MYKFKLTLIRVPYTCLEYIYDWQSSIGVVNHLISLQYIASKEHDVYANNINVGHKICYLHMKIVKTHYTPYEQSGKFGKGERQQVHRTAHPNETRKLDMIPWAQTARVSRFAFVVSTARYPDSCRVRGCMQHPNLFATLTNPQPGFGGMEGSR